MPGGRLRLLFMGTPEFTVPVLESLIQAENVEVVGVYTPPDRPKGRGRAVEMPPVKSFALDQGLPVFQPASLRPETIQQELAALDPDVIVVAAYGKLLPEAVLTTPAYGCLNLHPSLLPKYRGPSPVATTILEGEPTTGVTLMLLDQGMDTGPIIAQRECSLLGGETAGSLTEALFRLGGELLLENLGPWVAGEVSANSQDESLASITSKLQRQDGEADWRLSAKELERRHRAFTPWPGLFTVWEGKVLKLLDVKTSSPGSDQHAEAAHQPGRVVATTGSGAEVATGEGMLELRTVQLEGRRAQSASEFMRGYPSVIGSLL
ncbi:MAG: methionyl-tRNA formyltransferase [SAR202 cluster bacterium Io17-Chloro-G7]|nr:MAG: methionyl-tRNA formyltransferase [SAR202 cluster bacterium Io17-Chloro-G7]